MVPQRIKNNATIKCETSDLLYVGNKRCHMNCLSYYRANTQIVDKIIGVAQVFDDGKCVAHFVIKLKNGNYIDPTHGNISGLYDSLIPLKEYKPESFNPYYELTSLKDYIFEMNPWYYRWFHKNLY